MTITIKLADTLMRLENEGVNLTKHAIAVESRTRPSTLSDLTNGSSKAIKFETLNEILNAMNRLYPEGNFTITDIIDYKFESNEKE